MVKGKQSPWKAWQNSIAIIFRWSLWTFYSQRKCNGQIFAYLAIVKSNRVIPWFSYFTRLFL